MLDKVIYQIYVKSFNDSNNDGIGDIAGIIEKLPYLALLKIDYLWLTPVFKSPQQDNGYDVSDYYAIDPLFGSIIDLELLISEAEKYGLKIMLDMVFNHTSTDHEWFQKALAGDTKYQDFYFFSSDKYNWQSKFGGDAWEYIPSLDKYYLHLFDKTQADLNWDNDAVRLELHKVVKYWISKGIKGFRFDVINLVSKHQPFCNSLGDGREQYTDGPKVHQYLQELNQLCFSHDVDFITVGELSSTTIEECLKYANNKHDELHCVFHFHHLKVDYKNGFKWTRDYFDFIGLKKILADWQLSMNENDVCDALFWSNHDQPRIASRFYPANTHVQQNMKNKMLAISMYLMRGISCIYQGEELGIKNANFSQIDLYQDVESINFYNSHPDPQISLEILKQKSRDNGRTVMQWNNEEYHGFSNIKPWLSVVECNSCPSFQDQQFDPDSTYSFYKFLIALKKECPPLIYGDISFEQLDHEQLFIYSRMYAGETYLIVCNFTNKTAAYQIEAGYRLIYSNSSNLQDLLPFQALILHNSTN